MDFGWHMEVASLEAIEEIMVMASFPLSPIGFYHRAWGHIPTLVLSCQGYCLEWCFLDSVVRAEAVADTPASNQSDRVLWLGHKHV